MDKTYIAILAPTIKIANQCAETNSLQKDEWIHVYKTDCIRGLRFTKIIATPGFYRLPDADRILIEAKRRLK